MGTARDTSRKLHCSCGGIGQRWERQKGKNGEGAKRGKEKERKEEGKGRKIL